MINLISYTQIALARALFDIIYSDCSRPCPTLAIWLIVTLLYITLIALTLTSPHSRTCQMVDSFITPIRYSAGLALS